MEPASSSSSESSSPDAPSAYPETTAGENGTDGRGADGRSAQDPDAAEAAPAAQQQQEAKDRVWLHVLLFVLTFGSTVYAGAQWADRLLYYEQVGEWALFYDGLRYAIPLVLFLTVHEFGHYFAARYHGINTSLPYYIPFPFNGIGNFGAVISIREPIPSMRKLFDVGASGPLAGFVIALATLILAMATLPPPEYLLDLPGHEALKEHIRQHGTFPDAMPTDDPEGGVRIVVGQTVLYWVLSQFFAHVPPMYEMYHYPMLFAGWLGLFFTALNLLPVGQLDGGHVLYALFGKEWHGRLARGFVILLLVSGGIGFMEEVAPAMYDYAPWLGQLSWAALAGILYFYLYRAFGGQHRMIVPALGGTLAAVGLAEVVGAPLTQYGYTGWLVWTLLIVFLIRVEHPPVVQQEPLSPRRRLLGILSIIIFLLCFSIQPLSVV